MTWVRLIGGIANGKVQKVDPDQPTLVARETLPVSTRCGITTGRMSADVKQTLYTRRTVHTPHADITFFADEAMSDYEALYSVLGP